ncbi:hypothetical protein BD770DRAFT_382672 [Pilaira anomala]|nr:hypothetical protein BD770DRAFT_382672 [Pilaira anomala]
MIVNNQEELPAYDLPPSYVCTVYKEGYVRLKKELTIGGYIELKDRSWHTLYFKLRGTLLQVFQKRSSRYPLYSMSMFKANCGIAQNYTKHDNVLRLCTSLKDQYLLRPVAGIPDIISWFEHLQSSINISTDIDKRRMPRILTLARGNTTERRTVSLMVGKTQAIIPILKCCSQK